MAQNATVVYYKGYDNSLDAFHVTNISNRGLQAAFSNRDVHTIKHITIENEALYSKSFNTIFSESDIKVFLDTWKVDF